MSKVRGGHRRESVRDELLLKARDLFGLCDTEGKGFATKTDMLRLQGELSLPPEQLGEVFDALDQDGNGRLTLDEFKDGFGMFLGVDINTWNNLEVAKPGKNRTNSSSADSKDDEIDSVADDQQFEEFLDQLGVHNVFRDEDYIRQMWEQVRKLEPSMVHNFEDFLGKVTYELKNSKKEYVTLESTLKNRNDVHDREVQLLYMEMEEQLQSEKEHLLAQERMKERKVKDEMESELLLKDQQLQELLIKHSEMEKQLRELNSDEVGTKHENAKLQKERDGLELRLEASERILTDMKKHLDELRRRSVEERRRRAQAALKVSEGIALERENLVSQLHMLQQVNKQLLDQKDELMLSASNTSFGRTPEKITSSSYCNQHELDQQDQTGNLQRSCHSAHTFPESKTSAKNDEETVISQSPDATPKYAVEQKAVSIEMQSVKTSPSSQSLTATQHPRFQKYEDDCEVDDSFFENNPHFLDIQQERRLGFLQNNLNNSTPKKINAVDVQSIASDESNENTMEKPQNEFRKPSKAQGRKSAVLHQQCHPIGEKSIGFACTKNRGMQDEVTSPERIFKVVFVGDSGVGKTSFIHRFCNDTFRPTFSATIGVDFQVKTLQVDDHLIALQLWDTAGQERFRSLTKQYFRKADGMVIVYDVTSETSFKNIRNWISQIKEGADEHVVMMLIGNKLDLCENDDDRVVKTKDGNWLADEFGCLFFETSAKTGTAVEEAVSALSRLLQEKEDEVIEKVLQLQEAIRQKKKCC